MRKARSARLFGQSKVEFHESRGDTWITMSTTLIPTTQIALPISRIADFCRRWKIIRLEIFGSALRDDFNNESDVDFLYTLAPDAHWGWEIVTIEEELGALVGRPVDLVSREGVERSRNWIRRKHILESAHEIYHS